MDDPNRQEFDRALARGARNLEMLRLAGAWCRHMAWTKGPLGTGLVEAMTGLPVTGGSLRCDHAKAPSVFSVALENTALEFYETNCVGCDQREPTEAQEHLGTWAEVLIREREESRRAAREAQERAEQMARRRAERRRLVLGEPSPVLQSILDLLDRIDSDKPDREAERLLVSHARLGPEDFPETVIQHMAAEALSIGSATLLESVVVIFEKRGVPSVERMVEIAFQALTRGVAQAAAGRVIAGHAERFDVDPTALGAIIQLAGGRAPGILHPSREGEEPAALARYYDVDPDGALALLRAELLDERAEVRATAAHAVGALDALRPEAARGLLPTLLDALKLHDTSQYLGDPFAAGEAQEVVGKILVEDPVNTARVMDERLAGAEDWYVRALWRCYDRATRGRLTAPSSGGVPKTPVLPPAVVSTIVERAMAMLRMDLDSETAREVAHTLCTVIRDHLPGSDPPLAGAVEVVTKWAGRLEAVEAESQDVADPMGEDLRWLEVRSVLTGLEEVLEACIEKAPLAAVEMMSRLWADSVGSPGGRESLLHALAHSIKGQQMFAAAVPVIFTALEGDRPGERAAALRVVGEGGGREVVLPDELNRRIVSALLNDPKEVVVMAAVRAIAHVEPTAEEKQSVARFLVALAHAYGPYRRDEVRLAVRLALRFSKNEPFESEAQQAVFDVVDGLPTSVAVEVLERLPLESHPAWPRAVARALRLDHDPRWHGLYEVERVELLRELAGQPTERVSRVFDELEQGGLERLPGDPMWAWAIADVMARHHDHARAGRLCDAVVASLADTHEQAPGRRFGRQIALGHHLDAAAVEGDDAMWERLMQEWADLAEVQDG